MNLKIKKAQRASLIFSSYGKRRFKNLRLIDVYKKYTVF